MHSSLLPLVVLYSSAAAESHRFCHTSRLCKDNVNRLIQEPAHTKKLFSGLCFPPEKNRRTGTHTPGVSVLLLRREPGSSGEIWGRNSSLECEHRRRAAPKGYLRGI
ncbi:hypothetical protein F5Y07DRAFT_301570 [Xylaria sp. FL0933]|nr:hypothetical protein F5Y07DRAFT_301570 [Xylaria sp. FL0933]